MLKNAKFDSFAIRILYVKKSTTDNLLVLEFKLNPFFSQLLELISFLTRELDHPTRDSNRATEQL